MTLELPGREDPALTSYLEAHAAYRKGDLEAAREAARALAAGEGWLAPKARMLEAATHFDARAFPEAEALLRAEAEHLLSAARRDQVAAIYLELAAAAADAGDDPHQLEGKADHDKALRLYDYLVEQDLSPATRDEVLFRRARAASEGGREHQALGYFLEYLGELDPAFVAEVRGQAARADAPVGRYVTEARLGALEVALKVAGGMPDLEVHQDDISWSRPVDAAVVTLAWDTLRKLESGALAGGALPEGQALRRVRFLRPLVDGLGVQFDPEGTGALSPTAARRAVAEAQEACQAMPDTAEALELHRRVLRALWRAGFDDEARQVAAAFLEAPGPQEGPLAERHARVRAETRFALGQALFDAGQHEAAREEWKRYLSDHPDGPHWSRAQAGVDDALAARGARSLADGDDATARELWRQLAARKGAAREATWLYLAAAWTLRVAADRAEEAGDAARARALRDEAVEELGRVASRDSSGAGSWARFARGELYRDHLDDLEAAVREFRLANTSQAQDALAALTSTELELSSPRVRRLSEGAAARVTVRNVEKLEARLFRINLDDYFAKYHQAGEVARLDLDLVAPDRSWTWEVPEYRRYQRFETEIPLEVDGPGAYALAVEGGGYEAAVMVLYSDLDLIAAHTPKESVLLVKDASTQAPVEGAAVTVWAGDGPARGLALTTDAEGLARGELADQANQGPRCLALHQGQVAVTGASLPSITRTRPPPRGHLETSLPVYQPGDTARVRGILRVFEGGKLTFDPGSSWLLTLLDPSGRRLATRRARLSRFGTFEKSVRLPADATLGSYSFQVRPAPPPGTDVATSPVFTHAFEVRRVEPARVRLTVTPSTPAALPGDEVEVRVEAAYYTGAPLVARKVHLTLPDGRQQVLETDASGKATHALDTTPFFQQASLTLTAELPGEDARALATLHLVPAAVLLEARVPSDPVDVGARLAVPVTVTDPAGDPAAGVEVRARVSLLRPTPATGIPEDVTGAAGLRLTAWAPKRDSLVHEVTLTSDAAGRASIDFVPQEAGSMRITLAARDDSGREQVLNRTLRAREPARETLRLTAQEARTRVGATCRLDVLHQAPPSLGLLLWTGDDILDHRTHRFEQGEGTVEFEVTADHAPNLRLVALSNDAKGLLRAEQDLEVRRRLTVELAFPEGAHEPGSEVEATLTARDEGGAPVEAELALGLVDLGLLGKYPDTSPALVPFFEEGLSREVPLQAGASTAFRDRGEKREISKAILDELARAQANAVLGAGELDALLGAASGGGPGFGGFSEVACEEEMDFDMGEAPMPAMQMAMAPPPAPKRRSRGGGGRRRSRRMEQKLDSLMDDIGDFDDFDDAPAEPAPAAAERDDLATASAWLPAIVTDAQGRATVTVPVPPRATTYRARARGVTPATLVGEAEVEVLVRRPLTVEVRCPSFLREGDQVQPMVRVHAAPEVQGPIEVRLELRAGATHAEQSLEVQLDAAGVGSAVAAPFQVPLCRKLTLVAQGLREGQVADQVRRTCRVGAWGFEEHDGRAGTLTDAARFQLDLPEGIRAGTRRLEVRVYPALHEAVLDSAGRAPIADWGAEALACRILALVAARQAAGQAGEDGPRVQALTARARAALGALLAAQREDGAWAAVRDRHGRLGGALAATSWACMALSAAREASLHDDPRAEESARNWLGDQSSKLDSEEGIDALLAMARAGRAEFQPLNRHFRSRQDRSPSARAALGLALHHAGHVEQATTLAGELAADLDDSTPVKARALALELWGRIPGHEAAGARHAEALQASAARTFGADRWRSLASLASRAGGPEAGAGARFEVAVTVNGAAVGTYSTEGGEGSGTFVVEDADLADGPTVVELRLSGRGAAGFAAHLTGNAAELTERKEIYSWGLHRSCFYHSPRLYRGRPLRRSDMRVSKVEYEDFVQGSVELFGGRRGGTSPGDFLVMQVPLPAGVSVDPSTIPEKALAVTEDDGQLALLFHGRPPDMRLRLLPTCPGRYRTPPPELWGHARPHVRDRLGEARDLEVLAPGQEDDTPYIWTRDEHRAFGLAHAEDGDHEGALGHLQAIPKEARKGMRDVVLALLAIRCADAHYEPAEVVDLFEVLEQKYPDETVSYERLLKVGRAYHDVGEDEAACHLWRATLEASFRDDVPVAAELEGAGEYLRGVRYLYDLFWQYPDLPLVSQGLYGLAQDVYAHKQDREAVKPLRTQEVVAHAARLLRLFLDQFEALPYADEAAFSLVAALRELERHEASMATAEGAAARYPKSKYVDRFRYMRALAAFGLTRFDEATQAAAEVAAGGGPDAEHATYLLAQMYQALDRPQEALESYREVRGRFSDAELSIEHLERPVLHLPEVVTGAPGAPLSMEVRHRNCGELEVLAYKVDLMRLFLKERNLDRVAGVNLAGITPTSTFSLTLDPSPAGATGRTKVQLPFEALGAYLILARAGAAFASSLALVTPLTLEVQPLASATRVTVLDGDARRPAEGVLVKASDGGSLADGRTDLRGCTTLSHGHGEATVVARRGADEYAFHRATPASAEDRLEAPDIGQQVAYDAEVQAANLMVQQQASQALRANFTRRSKKEMGLKAKAVRK